MALPIRLCRWYKTGARSLHYDFVVVGGGAGGLAVSNKLARKMGPTKVAIVEPSESHYYQPMFTLVGGGIKPLEETCRPTERFIPKGSHWIKERVVKFDPETNTVITGDDQQVKGLPEALEIDPMVCSNYSKDTVTKTFPALEAFQGGNAIFTFPNTPIKCAGAPQKIMYLAEQHFTKKGIRDKTNVLYNTSLGVIFGVKKYAESLMEVVNRRGINVNYKHNLIEVNADKKEAIFAKLDSDSGETTTFKYDFLHATPPMSSPDVIQGSPLADKAGFVDVDKFTLQHIKYPNVFGLGDCTNIPTAKTAAAVAGQCGILFKTMQSVIKGEKPSGLKYDGYTSCPLITSDHTCILAEFDFNGQPLETMPLNQGKERRLFYYLKKDVMPQIYWNMLLRGNWNGPRVVRKMMHLGMSK